MIKQSPNIKVIYNNQVKWKILRINLINITKDQQKQINSHIKLKIFNKTGVVILRTSLKPNGCFKVTCRFLALGAKVVKWEIIDNRFNLKCKTPNLCSQEVANKIRCFLPGDLARLATHNTICIKDTSGIRYSKSYCLWLASSVWGNPS